MSNEHNNDRPKRPRISKPGGSSRSFGSDRGRNSFRSDDKLDRGDFKPRNSDRNFDGGRNSGTNRNDDRRGSGDFKPRNSDRNFDGERNSGRNDDRIDSGDFKKSYSRDDRGERPYNSDKKFSKGPSKFGGSNDRNKKPFDARDKYEKGNLKFGKKPFNKFDDRNDDRTKSFVQKRRLEKIDKDLHKETIRLNKFVANAGICSRREADTYIAQGLVEVNGKVVTEMGYQVEKTDRVVFDGQTISAEKPVYVLLNKPKGYISTTKDEKARKTVMDLVANASPYRLFPVGRLDRTTTGVILLTNDGHMTKKLTHPSFDVKKIYHVVLDRKLSQEDMKTIAEGLRFDEGVAEVDAISYIDGKPKNEIGIEIHIGWNRIVRRIFQRMGYEVEALDRVMFAGMTKKNIKRGHWRILTEQEVNNLKML